jgi:hypothetical protein
MRTPLVQALLLAALASGCTGSGQVYYSGEVTTPDLVYVGPDVQVIADYDEPIFYSDSYYWRNDGGIWYRSRNYRGGWGRYDNAPVAIRRIDRPTAYVHYRGTSNASGGVQVRDHREPAAYRPAPEVRDHRDAPVQRAPEVRDHRDERPAPAPVQRAPEVRDHREERPAPAPVQRAPEVRDHREERPAPRPAPEVRDHRDDKKKR